MTETIAAPESPAAESPHIPRPQTDGSILDNFASKDMPGRRRNIQECVDKILAKVNPEPAAS